MKTAASEKDIDIFGKEITETLSEQYKRIEEIEQKRKYDIELLNHTNERNYTLETKMRYHLIRLKESMKEFSYWLLAFIAFHIIEICFIYYLFLK